MSKPDTITGLEIAVIGMSGRFPESKSIDALWNNLKQGRELIRYFSDEELRESGVSAEQINDPRYVKAKGFLDDVEYFDAPFFGYTNKEADYMDPQLRIFHECAYNALENAGYASDRYRGVTGLFAGAGFNPFWIANFLPGFKDFSDIIEISSLNARDYLTTRVAYKLNLSGPSITLQTACSTSLVAIHLASQSLLSGECDMALAGGVSVLFPDMGLPRRYGMKYQEGMIISPDGHCRPFDKDANGFMGGDGVGIVVLKRLDDAIQDGDSILAVIKGSAINNDGGAKAGYAAPSITGQRRVIQTALSISGVNPESIGYIETHGSGTPLGDPIEVEGLKHAYKTQKTQYCGLGSIKSNVGHLDAAAGVAGFIKTVLTLKHKQIPPSINYSQPNPKIDFENSPFYVNTALKEWRGDEEPRRAAISSFGIGGTNAHFILEEAPDFQPSDRGGIESLVMLSARTERALDSMCKNLKQFLEQPGEKIRLRDLAYTLQVGRNTFEFKKSFVCTDIDDLIVKLSANEKYSSAIRHKANDSNSIVFVFSGLGSQYVGMGLGLYLSNPVFRTHMDDCFTQLMALSGMDLKSILYPSLSPQVDQSNRSSSGLQNFEVAQLSVFAVGYSMANVLIALGIQPAAVMGYSFGEYTAACISGMISLQDVLRIITRRGQCIADCENGAMVSVPLTRRELANHLPKGLAIAIDNGESCVVSGPLGVITTFEERMRQERVVCLRLQAQYALHSPMMAPVLTAFEKDVRTVTFQAPRVPFVSNVTGTWLSQEIPGPDYWLKHLTETVEFSKCIDTVLGLPNMVLIEIGPGADITSMLQNVVEATPQSLILNTLRPEASKTTDTRYFLTRLQKLWQRDVAIHWHKLYEGERRKRIPLPEYPFEKHRYWFKDHDSKEMKPAHAEAKTDGALVKNPAVSDWIYVPSWEQERILIAEEEFTGVSNWLIFSDRSALSLGVIEALKASKQNVVVVEQGKTFERSGNAMYRINPDVDNAYRYLVSDLLQSGYAVESVLHLWNSDTLSVDALTEQGIDQCLSKGFYSLTGLVRGLHENGLSDQEVKVFIVTSGVYAVTGGETLSPVHASILGASKVLPIEFRNIRCFHIDVDQKSVGAVDTLVGQIQKELMAEKTTLAAAWRGKERWVLNYKKFPIAANPTGVSAVLKHHNVYLIVGGLCTRSNLGFILSKYLSRQVQARIVLLSRTIYPDRSEWQSILSGSGNAALKEKIAQVREIERHGGEVFTAYADITQREQFQTAVAEIEQRVGKINGVINVAGIMSGKSMDLIANSNPRKDFKVQFDIKIKGSMNVYHTFIGKNIDFCLFSSSLTAVMGPFSAYAGANNVIDVLIDQANRVTDSAWISINWDHLLGFADKQSDQPLAISHDEIIDCFERIIATRGLHRVVISSGDIQTRISRTFRWPIHSASGQFQTRNVLSKWFYKPEWHTQAEQAQTSNPTVDGSVMFVNDSRLTTALRKKIKGLSDDVITVTVSDVYQKNGRAYSIDPGNASHYRILFDDIKRDGFEVRTVFQLWNVADVYEPVDTTTIDRSQDIGFYSLLNSVRALSETFPQQEVTLRVVTNNMQDVRGVDALCPEKATLLGAIKIAPVEHTKLTCISMDVDADEIAHAPDVVIETLATQILGESAGSAGGYHLLAYRDGQRYTQRYIPARLERTKGKVIFRENGVYLITGGLGGMALELVDYLAQHYQAKFILVDKKDFPARKDWRVVVEHNETPDVLKAAIKRIEKAELYGAEFVIAQADVANGEAMAAIVSNALESFGTLHGVFHIAGLIDHGGMIQHRTMDETTRVLAPKLTGALVLNDILKHRTLDFTVYFSSTGNVFPRLKFGQVAYNAGHEFVDMLARAQRRSGARVFSINWNDWRNTGIAAEAAKSHDFKINNTDVSFEKILSIKAKEGIVSLMAILESDHTHVILSAFDVNTINDFVNQINLSDLSDVSDDHKIPDKGVRPELSSVYVAPETGTESRLVEIFQTLFRIDTIGIDDDFFELGGDSIKAISAISLMQQKHSFDLPITTFFTARTARNMAAFLAVENTDAVQMADDAAEVPEDSEFYKPFPISAIQLAYLMGRSEHFDMGGISTNVYQESEITVDTKLLNDTFNRVLNRHPMLKITVLPNGTQQFNTVTHYDIKNRDLRNCTEEEKLRHIQDERVRLSNHVFDASLWPLFEISTLRLTDEKSYLFFCLDHLICDAASIMIFVKDWAALLKDPSVRLPVLNYTYRDYILDFQKQKASAQFEKSKRYWTNKLDDFPLAPALPFRCNPGDIQKPKFKRQRKLFSKQEWEDLKTIARKNGCTPSVILCTAYARVLAFWSNSNALAVNLTLFNRYPFHDDVQKIVGDFTMLVLLGLDLKPHDNFLDHVKVVQRTLLEALDNRFYDGIDFIRELRKRRQLGTSAVMPFVFTSALFDSELTATEPDGALGFWGQQRDAGMAISQTSQVYIDCTAAELHGGLELVWDYVEELFDEEVIHTMFTQFTAVLDGVLAANYTVMLSPPASHRQLADSINNTTVAFPDTQTVKEIFEHQVSKTPDHVALFNNSTSITFQALNARANRLARVLRAQGVTSESVVAIMAERSIDMVVGIYAIIKSGGAYLPITPGTPEQRVDYMLGNAGVRIIVLQRSMVRVFSADVTAMVLEDEENYHPDGSDLETVAHSENLAYIIYTSGSTGNPKGVMIEHRSLVNRLNWMQHKYPLTEGDKLIQKTPIGFDVSVWELFWWNFQGASLGLLPTDSEKSPELLVDFIERHQITTIHFVPSMFRLFINYLEETGSVNRVGSLKWVFTSGEALQPVHVEKFNALLNADTDCRLINLYGPTEATIDVSYFNCSGLRNPACIPIGKPIHNTKLYILDELLRPVPVGVAGQLYISGTGVARGYINRETLTQEKFIPDVFNPSIRMYATGDNAMRLPKGDILYLGRIDNQVKIRGNRIETGEIEKCLTRIRTVHTAVVIDRRNSSSDPYLCAYLVAQEELSVSNLRRELSLWLPDYMIPAYFVYLEEIPVTANGKINRNALPDPDMKINVGGVYHPPDTSLQHQLVSIFSKLLDVAKIGIDDSFFDLGGDSFKATFLLTEIQKSTTVKLSLAQVFKTPSVRGLAEVIDVSGPGLQAPVVHAAVQDFYPLSSQQMRMYILNQVSPQATNYNINTVKVLDGDLDLIQFKTAIRSLIEKHEILRTSFHTVAGEPKQMVHHDVTFEIDYVNATTDDVDAMLQNIVRPFDMANAPLFRVTLIRLGEHRHLLVLDMHHIITDLPSLVLLIGDFLSSYQGLGVGKVNFQYKDYAVWQHTGQHKANIAKQKQYWLDQFADEIPLLDLRTDFIRPAQAALSNGDRIQFDIAEDLFRQLKQVAKDHDVTLHMLLMSAFIVFLSKVSGQEDIIVGSPVVGTRPPELSDTAGMFVNTIALRAFPVHDKSFTTFLREIKDRTLDNYQNLDFQFEDLVDALVIKRDLSRNPLFDVMFDIQNDTMQDISIPGLTVKDYTIVNRNANFDLTFFFFEGSDSLRLSIDYRTDLFSRDTIARWYAYYQEVLQSVTANSNGRIGDIEIVSKEEKVMLTETFNDTAMPYPLSETVMSLFERQAGQRPDQPAIHFGETSLSYRELKQQSDKIASYLIDMAGVVQGDLVGIMLERSEYLIPFVFGILKAGAAYVPVDPHYPLERVSTIIDDAQLKLLVTEEKYTSVVKGIGVALLDVRVVCEIIATYSVKAVQDRSRSWALAYVIYTSGSTGKPKGVMIEHHAVVNRILWMQKMYPLSAQDVLLQKTPVVFDVSVWELFWWSVSGASLCLLKPGEEKEPAEMINVIASRKVTTIHFVPSMLHVFLSLLDDKFDYASLASLRQVFASGEALKPGHVHAFAETLHRHCDTRLINLYGPTEATVDVSYYECDFTRENNLIPIGKPIDNIQLYILNKSNRLVPVGVAGELCIAGVGLSRGYINNERLTREKFVDSPVNGRGLMYRTGDLARWLPDGNIEYLGRLDHQVKIRGFRIELGDIESALNRYDKITDCAVVVKTKHDEQYLVAYYTSAEALDPLQLRSDLQQKLPEYMVPAYFIHLQALPLTANGKLNRALLPEPEIKADEMYAAPSDATEDKLVEIWAKILKIGKDTISIDGDFFSLGGNSLKVILLHQAINEHFPGKIRIANIFSYPTIRRLAQFIKNGKSPLKSGNTKKRLLKVDF